MADKRDNDWTMGEPSADEPLAPRPPLGAQQWGNAVATLIGLAWALAGVAWLYQHRDAIERKVSAALKSTTSQIMAPMRPGPSALDIEEVRQARDDVYRSSGCICGDDAVYGRECGPLGSIACMPYYCMRCSRLGRGCKAAREMPCNVFESSGE